MFKALTVSELLAFASMTYDFFYFQTHQGRQNIRPLGVHWFGSGSQFAHFPETSTLNLCIQKLVLRFSLIEDEDKKDRLSKDFKAPY